MQDFQHFFSSGKAIAWMVGDRPIYEIEANALLTTAKPGIPILVKGLPNRSVDYLIFQDGPQIAEYAIISCPVKDLSFRPQGAGGKRLLHFLHRCGN
ncbi:hypothetical protein [uncultured Nostoc sp.]|uniref:hypothetical protein n=1 Tax=uncultured Nostoc sp. TaxID=340711 RepID=UPI0035C9C8D2